MLELLTVVSHRKDRKKIYGDSPCCCHLPPSSSFPMTQLVEDTYRTHQGIGFLSTTYCTSHTSNRTSHKEKRKSFCWKLSYVASTVQPIDFDRGAMEDVLVNANAWGEWNRKEGRVVSNCILIQERRTGFVTENYITELKPFSWISEGVAKLDG